MIRTVFIDIGNVLFGVSYAVRYQKLGRLCGRDETTMRTLLSDSGRERALETGKISKRDQHQWLEEVANRVLLPEDVWEASSNIFTPDHDVHAVVEELAGRNLRLIILSNTYDSHLRWLWRNRVFDHFDGLIASHEVGAMKPDAAIYQAALAEAHCAPDECFFTDDNAAFVDGARAFGINAEVFTGASTLRRQLADQGIVL